MSYKAFILRYSLLQILNNLTILCNDSKGDDETMSSSEMQKMLTQYEDTHMGNFRRIYPPDEGTGLYEKYYESNNSIFRETIAFKARTQCAR